MLKGAYLAKTKGGTQTSNLPTNFSSVSSNQGGGPAGMTFQEAASVQTPGGGIMSQQEAQQAQQQINQNQFARIGIKINIISIKLHRIELESKFHCQTGIHWNQDHFR